MISQNAGAITITGRLTKDARTNTVKDSQVTNFTLAFVNGMSPKTADVDGRQQRVFMESTSYIEVAAWREESVHAMNLEKGQEVTVDITGLHAKSSEYQGKTYNNIHGNGSNIRPGAKAGKSLPNTAASSNAGGNDNSGYESDPEDDNSIPF